MTNIMFFGFLMLYICNVDKAQNKLKKIEIMKATVKSIGFSFNSIEVSLSNINYTHFISPNDVEWFSIDNTNRSIQNVLNIGTEIEFEIESEKTRNLKNVKFVK